MRVLMISKACIAGAYQRKLEEIAARDVDLTVAVPPYWRDDAGRRVPLERRHVDGYRLIETPMAFNGNFHVHFYPGLARIIRDLHPDLVHMDEEPYNVATAQALWLARRAGARTLFFTWQNLNRRYPLPFRLLERYAYAATDGAIAGNRDAVDVLRAKGFSGRTWVIPQFGVDPALFTPSPSRDHARPFTVGWFSGRLHAFKGVHHLVEAVAALGGNVRLEVLGWGPEEGNLRALAARLGLGDRFRIVPGVPSHEVPAFARNLDVAVLPSLPTTRWKEQFGRMLIESMACGVAVVGSDSGEIPHLIGTAGLIFPTGDAIALADRLRQIRDDEALRASLVRRGSARVHAHFTQARIAAATVATYREVLARPADGQS
jgi:glycosyltransferase involved in cell wall biosynthesis